MRKAFCQQRRLDCRGVVGVQLNIACRDEIIPILRALQHLYGQRKTRDDVGREGMDYWEILVLAAVRLGCNLDYDKLQDLAEQHRALRHIMGVGDWNEDKDFGWRRIRDNVCLLAPATVDRISALIVGEGHRLAPDAAKRTRADSFVVETNIHWPSESTLIRDGVRKIIELCAAIACMVPSTGWRQSAHLLKKVRQMSRRIERIASRKGPRYQERLVVEYRALLALSGKITGRARQLLRELEVLPAMASVAELQQLRIFLERTEIVRDTARRRVLKGETVPNEEKLFSMFETHTQLYRRGKAGEPVQFGRLLLIYEDGAGFITHRYLLGRNENDRDVVVAQTRLVQNRLRGAIQVASFDRGFHTPENQLQLVEIVATACLPKPGVKQASEQSRAATVTFRAARQHHAGVESAIGALQSGNGLDRSRDRTEIGFDRYTALGVLGRKIHVLGKLLIAREASTSEAARSKRRQPAA